MLTLCREFGFSVAHHPSDQSLMLATLNLQPSLMTRLDVQLDKKRLKLVFCEEGTCDAAKNQFPYPAVAVRA